MADDISVVPTVTAQTAATGEQPSPDTTPATDAEAGASTSTEAPAEGQAEGGAEGAGLGETEADNSEQQRRNNVPAKERIRQLTDKVRAKDATITTLQTQIATLQQGTQQLGDPLEYETDAAYMQAVADNAARQATVAALQAQQQSAAQERQMAVMETWNEKCSELRSSVQDFDAVAFNPKLPVPQHVTQIILGVDNGPGVAYYLGKNPAEAARIARLAPMEAALAIGGLSQRLAAPPVKRTPQAPAPVRTVSGAGNTPSVDPANLSMRDYKAWRAKQGK